MKTAIVNIKTIVTGDWRKPFAKGDAILMNKGKITKVGTVSQTRLTTMRDEAHMMLSGDF